MATEQLITIHYITRKREIKYCIFKWYMYEFYEMVLTAAWRKGYCWKREGKQMRKQAQSHTRVDSCEPDTACDWQLLASRLLQSQRLHNKHNRLNLLLQAVQLCSLYCLFTHEQVQPTAWNDLPHRKIKQVPTWGILIWFTVVTFWPQFYNEWSNHYSTIWGVLS